MSEVDVLNIIADWLQENHTEALLQLEPAQVDMGTSIADGLQLDSLDQIEFIMALEEQFQVLVPDEEAGQLQTVGDAVRFIKETQAAAAT